MSSGKRSGINWVLEPGKFLSSHEAKKATRNGEM